MRAALLLFLCACAGPAQYERGTVRPAPAPVRPGVGAPTVGQPGMRPDSLPRGPYTRVLPPTREPGIWAADPPRASLPDDAVTFVLDVWLKSTGERRIDGALRQCAAVLDAAGTQAGLEPHAMRFAYEDRACVVASMMAQCAYMVEEAEKRKAPTDEVKLAQWSLAARYLASLANTECVGRLGTQHVSDMLARWSAALRPTRRGGVQQ